MKFLLGVFLSISVCWALLGYQKVPNDELNNSIEESNNENTDSCGRLEENLESNAESFFAMKEYLEECVLLTQNQQLCNELIQNLQVAQKDIIEQSKEGFLLVHDR